MCHNPPLVCDKLLGAPAFVKLVYCWYTGDTSKPSQYKDVLPDIGISVIKIIVVSWSSCLYNGNHDTWNDLFLYWNRAQSSTEPLILALSYFDVLCVIFRWRRRSHYVYGSPWPSQPHVMSAAVPQPTHVQKGKHGMIFLTLNVRGLSHLGLTRTVSWLLMPWLFASAENQHPRYWLCGIVRPLSYYSCLVILEEWHKM